MRHPRGRSRNLLITIVVAVLICVPTGIAIAGPPAPADPAVEQACSNRYDEESLGYQACLQAATESPPATTTLITAIDGYQPDTPPAASDDSTVVQYCDTGNGTYRTGAADCPRPITCTRQADTGKYQCLDPTGIPINPPGDICERSPAYVCTYTSSLTSEQLTAGQSAPLPTDLPSPPPAATTSQSAAPQPTSTAPTPDPTLTPTPAPTPTPTSTATPTDPVGQSVQQANALNMRIWLEGDLTAAWREGAASLAAAVKRLSAHAAQPGVIGVKFAHDLGLTGFPSTRAGAADLQRFLTDTIPALRAALPAGRNIVVDVAVPELGCGRNQTCIRAMRTKYPLLTVPELEKRLLGAVDAINVTGDLFLTDYQTWKITEQAARRNLWLELARLNWDTRGPALLGARDTSLVHNTDTSPLSAAAAKQKVTAVVDTPVQLARVNTVVLRTHRQTHDGDIWRILNADLHSNQLWEALRARRALGKIAVTFNPADVEKSIPEDLKIVAQIASTVYIFAQ
ncbi:hypothetical protein J2853_009805 [Streptosporangium lutulentum]|uniref:Uncharacterized protein n=1 Tax=Streptosporangium lutulentum TaxID=1461250 RepID=A0ABT9QX21_9ACTN|nr:hypothetical protein [Streptosporangium lutulentum]MDP9850509.1 hypothetical protein [Streptosporangium lutulentum]